MVNVIQPIAYIIVTIISLAFGHSDSHVVQETIKLAEGQSIKVRPGTVLENVTIDARKNGGDPGLVFEGQFTMFRNARVRNVKVLCSDDTEVGVLMRSTNGNQISFNHIDVTVFRGKIGLLMDATEGAFISSNQIKFNGYRCKTFISMRSRNGVGVGGNFVSATLQPKETELGIYCDGRANQFQVMFWDRWAVDGVTAIRFGKSSRRNLVFGDVPTMIDTNPRADNQIFSSGFFGR